MSKLPFNVDANTARIIGRENVSKLDGALIELVKNTYDADASICIIYYEESTRSLYIADNGSGMSSGVIKDQWMTIGYSEKFQKVTSDKGRIVTGSKGIGRFALDRLANSCVMFTKQEYSPALEWSVNWTDFKYGKNITEITADLEETQTSFSDFIFGAKNSDFKNLIASQITTKGTILHLTNLNPVDNWSEKVIEGIREGLSTLIPPGKENKFKIYFFTEDFSEEDAQILVSDTDAYDYKIKFKIDKDGVITVILTRNEFDLNRFTPEIMMEMGFNEDEIAYFHGKPIEKTLPVSDTLKGSQASLSTLGPFQGTLYFMKREIPKTDKEYYYKQYSYKKSNIYWGIRLYRDEFRVRHYGEFNTAAYDWLSLSNIRSQSPSAISGKGPWHASANQMSGYVHISRVTNVTLPDQSNREGIVETADFILFRQILLSIIREFEKDRQSIFRRMAVYYSGIDKPKIKEDEIKSKADLENKLKKKLANPTTVNNADKYRKNLADLKINASDAKTVFDEKDRLIEELQDENRHLRLLSTVGIVTNTYFHEIRDSAHRIKLSLRVANDDLQLDRNIESALIEISKSQKAGQDLTSWFGVTLGSVRQDKRTRKLTNLYSLLTTYIESWKEVTGKQHITFEYTCDNVQFKCYPYEIESILTNLIVNSVTSFKRYKCDNPKIIIDIQAISGGISLSYSDNGNGLSEKYKVNPDQILEPFETDITNSNGVLVGTGMGMWIINSIAAEYNGSIDLSKNIKSTQGFHIKLILKERTRE